MAFLGWNGSRWDSWLFDIPTKNRQKLSEEDGRLFTWSPMGDALAFVRISPSSKVALRVVDVSGAQTADAELGIMPGTEGCQPPPTWLLDGEKVLVTILLTPGVWVVDRDGNVERLDELHLDKQGKRPSGLAAPHSGGRCDDAVASPDGRCVVYTAGGRQMYVMDLRTGKDLALGSGDLCHGGTKIEWAPRGPWFLRWGRSRPLELVDATSGSVQPLAPSGFWPAWSPEGQRVAYWLPEAEGYALWLLDLEDLRPIRLTSSSLDDPREWERRMPFLYDIKPRWSPDGDAIAFVSFREDHPEGYILQWRERAK